MDKNKEILKLKNQTDQYVHLINDTMAKNSDDIETIFDSILNKSVKISTDFYISCGFCEKSIPVDLSCNLLYQAILSLALLQFKRPKPSKRILNSIENCLTRESSLWCLDPLCLIFKTSFFKSFPLLNNTNPHLYLYCITDFIMATKTQLFEIETRVKKALSNANLNGFSPGHFNLVAELFSFLVGLGCRKFKHQIPFVIKSDVAFYYMMTEGLFFEKLIEKTFPSDFTAKLPKLLSAVTTPSNYSTHWMNLEKKFINFKLDRIIRLQASTGSPRRNSSGCFLALDGGHFEVFPTAWAEAVVELLHSIRKRFFLYRYPEILALIEEFHYKLLLDVVYFKLESTIKNSINNKTIVNQAKNSIELWSEIKLSVFSCDYLWQVINSWISLEKPDGLASGSLVGCYEAISKKYESLLQTLFSSLCRNSLENLVLSFSPNSKDLKEVVVRESEFWDLLNAEIHGFVKSAPFKFSQKFVDLVLTELCSKVSFYISSVLREESDLKDIMRFTKNMLEVAKTHRSDFELRNTELFETLLLLNAEKSSVEKVEVLMDCFPVKWRETPLKDMSKFEGEDLNAQLISGKLTRLGFSQLSVAEIKRVCQISKNDAFVIKFF